MKRILTIAACLSLLTALSCRRDEIVYATSNYYVSISLADSVYAGQLAGQGIFNVNLYDIQNGRLVRNWFIDAAHHPAGYPQGGWMSGLEAGDYHLVVWNHGTRVTFVENTENTSRMYATTGVISRSNDVPVMYAPDMLCVYSGDINVPYVTDENKVHIIDCKCEAMTKKWKVVVNGIHNAHNAQKISFLLSAQVRGVMLSSGDNIQERAILNFPGEVAVRTKAAADTVVVADFCTFGAMQDVYRGERRVLLTMQIEGPNGAVYIEQQEVTDQMVSDGGIIEISADINIEPRRDGGFNPKADPWDDNNTTIIDLS